MTARFRSAALFLMVCSCFGSVAFAGDEPPPPPPEGGPPPRMMRGGMQPSGMMMRPGAVEGVLDSLNLEDAQRQPIMTKVDEIRRANMEKMRAEFSNPEQMSQMRQIQEQMREARQNNDQAKLEELRKQMQDVANKRREASEQSEKEMHDAIVAMLHPDQVDPFNKAWDEAKSRPPMGYGRQGPRELRSAVMSLDLQPDQRTKLNQIFEDARKTRGAGDAKPMPMGGPGGDTTNMVELRKQVDAVLTDEQKTRLTQRLERMNGRGRRGPRGGRPDMPPGEGEPPPPPPGGP